MINGRILISNAEIDRWIKQAIETDIERLALRRGNEVDRELARAAPTGWSRIQYLLDDHCETWCFGAEDRKRIAGVVRPIYEEARKFFDL